MRVGRDARVRLCIKPWFDESRSLFFSLSFLVTIGDLEIVPR